ncbi:MAG: hypothetical protein E7255_03080 [Lachnospiraceae bacterium]|nr:hypothetical protein [Lachnospiraceae bacterium]
MTAMVRRKRRQIEGLILAVVAGIVINISGCSKTDHASEADTLKKGWGQEKLNLDQLMDAPVDSSAKGMKKITKNINYALYIDPDTADMAVYDNKAGIYLHSNPVRNIEDLSLDEVQQGLYGSMIEVNYTNLSGKMSRYSSYIDSVLLGQYDFYPIENGVRILYTLGMDESKRMIPPVLSVKSYEKILNQLEDDEKQDFRPLFRRIKHDSIAKEEKDALLNAYPILKTEDIYILREITKYDKDILEDILKAHAYTLEDIEAEMEYAGYERDDSNVVFTIPVDLQIDDQGLVAGIDCSFIKRSGDYKVTDISLLRGFGATNENDGFIFLPDGSGILLDLVGDKPMVYSKQVYGANQAISAPYQTENVIQNIMPVFGISSGKNALFGIIERGAGLTSIAATVRSNTTPLACVEAKITVNDMDYQDYQGLKTNPSGLVLPADDPEATVSVRYFLMKEENVSYSRMADLYRNYLAEKGVLKKQDNPAKVTPCYIEMPGSIKKNTMVVGVPVKKDFALTSYKQAEAILEQLLENGVKGMKFRYTGWVNDGLHNSVYDRPGFIKALGSKKELRHLLAYVKENSIHVFLDTEFNYVYTDKAFDGFRYNEDASRQLDHKVAVAGRYDPATLRMLSNEKCYLVSPDAMLKFSVSFFSKLNQLNFDTGISLGSMGRSLNGDYKAGHTVTRDRSEKIYQSIFADVGKNYTDILTEKGNAYSWAYVSDIVDLPIGGSDSYVQAQAVPFVQMVLHGYVDYASMPLNLASNLTYETLKAIETGSGIYAQMMYADDMVVVDTAYDAMYSLHYENQLPEVAAVYKKVAAVLDQVAGEEIINHQKFDPGVYGTTYSNGKQIIVNYRDQDWQSDGILVKGKSYVVMEVGEK